MHASIMLIIFNWISGLHWIELSISLIFLNGTMKYCNLSLAIDTFVEKDNVSIYIHVCDITLYAIIDSKYVNKLL